MRVMKLWMLAGALVVSVACEAPEWQDTVSTGPLSYEVTPDAPVFLEIRVDLEKTNGASDCNDLYATPQLRVLADAPEARLVYYYEPQMTEGEAVLGGLQAGDSTQPGDTKNLAGAPDGNCYTEVGLELLADAPSLVEIELEMVGRQASSSLPSPGEGLAFTIAVVER